MTDQTDRRMGQRLHTDRDQARAELGAALELIAELRDVGERADRAFARYDTRPEQPTPSLGSPADRPALDIAIRDQIAADALRWAADRIDPGPRASRPYPLNEQHDVMMATHHGTATNLRFWADQVLRGYIEPRPAGSTPPSLGSPADRAQEPDRTATELERLRDANDTLALTLAEAIGTLTPDGGGGWIPGSTVDRWRRALHEAEEARAQDAAQPATIAVQPPAHPAEAHREGDSIPEAHTAAEPDRCEHGVSLDEECRPCLVDTYGPDYHIGRAFAGTVIENVCPCRQAPCGLVVQSTADPDCSHHPTTAARTMRQIHRADQCPAEQAEGDGVGEGGGRCGDVAPTWALRADSPQPTCALPHGHAGWHRADDGCEWAEQAEDDEWDALDQAFRPVLEQAFDAMATERAEG